MRRWGLVAVVMVVFFAVPCFAADHAWRNGRLMSFTNESWTSSSTTPVSCGSAAGIVNCSGGQTFEWGHVTYHVSLMEGRTTYYASRTLSFRWQHSPRLTENAPIKFAIQGDKLFLLDDDGHEFKMYIGKKRNNTPAERLEECRTTMQEIHESYPDLPQVNMWLSGLSGLDLITTYNYNLECSTESIQLQDMPLLSQFEAVRAEMLVARAAKEAPEKGADAPDIPSDCNELAAAIEHRSVKDMTVAEISNASRRLYDCAMSSFKTDPRMWFLATARARNNLLLELIARQTGAPIGEHRQDQAQSQPAK